MRLQDFLSHPLVHAALENVGPDQHHLRPATIEVANTTQQVYPLPGDPAQWDIPLPDKAHAAMFSLYGPKIIAEGTAKPGVCGVANEDYNGATVVSMGGWTDKITTAYNAVYSRPGGAINLSHKIFTSAGQYISLTLAYVVTTPSGKVLRLEFTNYGAAIYTLWCKGEVQVLG